ncbi:DUF4199 family protein [Mucilaginibacter aquatilis]|uniref:DUF4199 family protein n=1 Tax=Mucilaginibacter aquatilis TaxID=1517760 RepID=A0A6I4I4A2_9SPHI|nr:DUF4199 family protein [Mucilaginibacter aquatilis]MVN89890.1 DUF4199 family protein [Mucilaginibacter aquatilis]
MVDLNAAVRKQGALRGLLFGSIMLIIDVLKLFYLAYVAKSPLVTFILLYPVYYLVLFGLALLFINNLRSKIGNYWSLKQAITGIFVMLIVSSLIWNNGVTLYSGKINPVVAQKAHAGLVDMRRGAMQSQKQPADKIEKEIADMNKNFVATSNFTIGSFFQSLTISIILVFAVAAVLGILFKREQPAQQA